MKRNRFRILLNILHRTHADEIMISFVVLVFVDAFFIFLTEPTITSYGDSLWYCFAVLSTIGFGDVVATAVIPKLLSLALMLHALFTLAILTGVVVNYYNQIIKIRDKETITAFLDKVERLPELTPEELEELSRKVKKFRNK